MQHQSITQGISSNIQQPNLFAMSTNPQQRKLLFVSKLLPSTTEVDLINFFLTYLKIQPLACHQLKPRLNFPPTFSSFKVELNLADFHQALRYTGWPHGVLIREFLDQPNSSFEQRRQLIGAVQ